MPLRNGILNARSRTASAACWVVGGTGISQRDRTYDVISRNLEKTLPGFGEIFRMLSYEEIGARLGLSLSATKSLLHRARASLKDELTACRPA